MWGSGISDACVRNWAEVMKDTSEIRRAGNSMVKYLWWVDQKDRGLFSDEGGGQMFFFFWIFYLRSRAGASTAFCRPLRSGIGDWSAILKFVVDCRFLLVWHVGAFLFVINRMWSATCFIIDYIGIKVLITDIVICGTNEHESTMLSDMRETGILVTDVTCAIM